MKIRKNYSTIARLFNIFFLIVCFLILYINNYSARIIFLVGVAIFLSNFSELYEGFKQTGTAMERDEIKEHVKFRLEKISGPGNERFYFIYEGKERLLYTDAPEFKDGIYVKDGDELLAEKDYVPRLPV